MASNNQVAVYNNYLFGSLTSEDIKTIHETIAKDCNEAQFKLFMGVAKAADANPLIGEIHPTVYQGKLTWQFGIDYHIRKAKEMEGYLGYDVQVIHENDTFEYSMERAEDGRYYLLIEKFKGGFPKGKPVGGYAMAYKEGFMPFTVLMDIDEVEHYKRSAIGMQKTMWTNNFNDMFKKHMVKRALKAAFGLRFDDGDGEQNAGPDTYNPYERKDVTPQETGQPATPQQPDQQEDESLARMKALKAQVKANYKKLGLIDKESMGQHAQQFCKVKGDEPTEAELKAYVKIMDMQIQEKQAAEQANDDLPL
ncbi:RecT family recombinase [Paenibacillus glucanolyticus]|uniref:RecT family recombinase n=1 Tax=Paenibacillus glucanolyticus TaxID=59843 RepID=UPI0030D19717